MTNEIDLSNKKNESKEPIMSMSNLIVLALFIATVNSAYLMPLMFNSSIEGAQEKLDLLNYFSNILIPLSLILAIANAVVLSVNGSNRSSNTAFILMLLPVVVFIVCPLARSLTNYMLALLI